jgi:hypothetical protein
MNVRQVFSWALAGVAAMALAACDGGREAPAKVTVRVANVAPGFAELRFRREQADTTNLVFRNAQVFSFDADTYDFYIDERTLGTGQGGRTWTFVETLRENREYAIVLTDNAGEASPVVLEYENPGSSSAQIAALHAGGGLPALDLYLEPPGAGIAGAAPRGTLAERGRIEPRTLAAGEYELWLTAAGNPANVLFTSSTIALSAATTAVIVVTPEVGAGTAALSVMLLQPNPAVLYDRDATAELRVVNGATDALPRDFAINNEFTPPLFASIPFGVPTAYAPVPVASSQPINVTPPGNPGVLELTQALTMTPSQRATILFAGEAGTLLNVVAGDDGRRLTSEAKVRLMNAASQFLALDFLLLEPGADPNVFQGDAQLAVPGVSDYVPRAAGDYDLYLRQTGGSTIVYGPTRVTLAAGGIYGVLAVNGPDTATAGAVLFDDFP